LLAPPVCTRSSDLVDGQLVIAIVAKQSSAAATGRRALRRLSDSGVRDVPSMEAIVSRRRAFREGGERREFVAVGGWRKRARRMSDLTFPDDKGLYLTTLGYDMATAIGSAIMLPVITGK